MPVLGPIKNTVKGVAREATLGRVKHPEWLRFGDGDTDSRQLIDDPVADRLWKGDAVLGWEGDDRLALYVNYTRAQYELVRLEADGKYRVSLAAPGFYGGVRVVAEFIIKFMEHDTRRGYDPYLDVVAKNTQIEMENARKAKELDYEMLDRVGTALKKDGEL